MRVIEPTVNIQLYNKSKVREGLIELNKTSNFKRERSKNGDATLSFSLPREEGIDICTEKYFKYDNQFYVLKNKNKSSQDTYSFTAYLNLEELESIVPTFESIEKTITECLQLALAGTDYTVGSCDVTKKRTIRVEQKSVRDIINQAIKTYRCYCEYDTINKVINIYENLGSYKGAFLSDELNLRELNFNENTNSFFTRIRPIGKDGLTIASVNDGSEYLENHQYSDKNITYYWKDERYTIAESLKEDAIAKLDELSKPQKSYSCKIRDLARLDPNNNSYLDYEIGDTLDLISNQDHIKDKQLVVKIIEYPLDPSQNSVEIANTYLSFAEIQQEYADNINTVNNITSDNGTVSPDAIRSSLISLINVDIQNLSAVSARIGELFTNQLRADVANINTGIVGKLLAQKIETKDLVASNVKFDIAEGGSLSLKDLLTQFLSANSTETLHLTAGNVVIDEAVIKDLIAAKISVGDLLAGNIDSERFNIVSKNGNLIIKDNTIQIKDSNRVRIQIGKDASGDYTLNAWDKNGKLLFNSNGITADAIKNPIIRDDMVADNANIDGSKVNIESLIECVNNNNTKTLNASKIVMDGTTQTMDVSFKQLTSTVESLDVQTKNLYRCTGNFDSDFWTCTHDLEPYENNNLYKQATLIVGDNIPHTFNTLTAKQGFNFSDTSKTWTISAYFKASADNMKIGITVSSNRVDWDKKDLIKDTWVRLKWTFKGDGFALSMFRFSGLEGSTGDSVKIALIKVAETDKLDDWCPHQDDNVKETNVLQTEFNVQQGQINQLIKDTTITIDGTEKKLKDAYNETKSTVDGTVQTVSKMETQVNSLNLTNLIRAGGGDYLNVSTSIWGKTNFTTTDMFTLDGATNNKWYRLFNTSSSTASNAGLIYVTNTTPIKAPSDKKISISFRYYCNDSNGKLDGIKNIRMYILQEHNNSNNFYNSYSYVDLDKTTAAKLYKGTFTLNSSCTRFMIRFDLANNAIASGVTTAFRFKDIMVVNGSIPANEWSPSFEDLQVDINSIESRVSSCEVKTTDEAFTVQVQKNQNRQFNVRYIRDYCNGNTSQYSNLCNWMEIQAISNVGTNLALNKTVTSNVTVSNLSYVTDGDYKDSSKYANATSSTTTIPYVQIDLGQVYSNIDEIKIWHYYNDGRKYLNTKTEISADGTHWVTLFDSAVSGTYVETIYGHSIKVNGTSFNSSQVTINELGLHVKNGAIDIENNAGTKVLEADTNGNLKFIGIMEQRDSTTGYLSTALKYNGLGVYDWRKKDDLVGGTVAVEMDGSKRGAVTLFSDKGNILMIGYRDTGTEEDFSNSHFQAVMMIDDTEQEDPGYVTSFYKTMAFHNAPHYYGNSSFFNYSDLRFYGRDKTVLLGNVGVDQSNQMFVAGKRDFSSPHLGYLEDNNSSLTYKLVVGDNNKGTTVYGDLTCTGAKPRSVKTKDYGWLAQNAFETAECYFGDWLFAKTDDKGYCMIYFEDKYLQTINTKCRYHVMCSAYGEDDDIFPRVKCIKQEETYFIIKSDAPGVEFSVLVSAKQKGYENTRLKNMDIEDVNHVSMYEELNKIVEEENKK